MNINENTVLPGFIAWLICSCNLGAKPVNGIAKNVDILVVGIISKPYDQLLTTQKLTYARTYGIPKIDELAFISWCQWRLDQLRTTL